MVCAAHAGGGEPCHDHERIGLERDGSAVLLFVGTVTQVPYGPLS
jgi:hypothetical protein